MNWRWLLVAVPAVYYGPRKVLEAWDWYVHRFRDEPILQVMHDRRLVPAESNYPMEQQLGPSHVPMTPNILIIKEGTYSVGDLSHILKRSHPSIGKSLRRLKAKGKVELYRGGFRLIT
jgi:hypothetical protein